MGTLDRMDHDRHETIDRSARRLVGEPAPVRASAPSAASSPTSATTSPPSCATRSRLAKSEVTAGLKIGGKGAGLLGAAAFIGLLGLIFLFHTIAQVIAIWLPVWAGYLITTALLFVVAGVLGLVGYKTVTKAKPVPKKAIRNAQETVEAIKPGR